jgi:hypothetical protein
LIAGAVAEVVTQAMDKKKAAAFIKQYAAKQVVEEDRARFVEVVETEVMSLHEGNFVRYRLRPSQYQSWKEKWR